MNIWGKIMKLKKLNELYKFVVDLYLNDLDFLLLMCVKYICNAFEYDDKPALLFEGAKFNHLCAPNVVFKIVNERFVFVSEFDIMAGDELCDNYVKVDDPYAIRTMRLAVQYDFVCECDRCAQYIKKKLIIGL